MLKQLFAALFLTSVAVAQPFPPREGPVVISQPGTGGTSSSGGLDTNAVIALIEEYAVGGGGIVSNANNLTFVALTIYTNDTVYPLMINASIENRGAAANGASSATIDVDQQPDGAFDYTRIFNLSSSATFTNRTMLTYTIEPGDAWRISTSGGAAIVSGGGQLLYFGSGTNSGGGGGVSAAEVASIMATNNAQGLTVNGMPAFPAVGAWGNSWEIVSKVLATGASYDTGGLRVATCYYDKDKINLYYAGYLMPILGGGTNYGQIIGVFGQNWDNMVKHGPVLSPSASGWDSGNIGGARVYKFDSGPTNYMFYFASSNKIFETGWQGQGLATSTDGTNWTKYAGNPILDVTTNGWDYIAIQGAVSVIKYNDIYYMYYGGKGTNSDENIGLATATSPYGPWTKYGNSPVVTNADDILAEPNVFPLENGRGWGMLLGQGAATSADLTNWTFHGSWAINSPYVSISGLNLFLSPFVFSDNGMASLFDNISGIYIARPEQVMNRGNISGYFTGNGGGMTNVPALAIAYGTANINASNAYNLNLGFGNIYYGTNPAASADVLVGQSIIVSGGTTSTGTWVTNNAGRLTNSAYANAAIFHDVDGLYGFAGAYIHTNAANQTPPDDYVALLFADYSVFLAGTFDLDGTWEFGPRSSPITWRGNFTGDGQNITNVAPRYFAWGFINYTISGTANNYHPASGQVHSTFNVIAARAPVDTIISDISVRLSYVSHVDTNYFRLMTNGVWTGRTVEVAVSSAANTANSTVATNVGNTFIPAGTLWALQITNQSASSRQIYGDWAIRYFAQ